MYKTVGNSVESVEKRHKVAFFDRALTSDDRIRAVKTVEKSIKLWICFTVTTENFFKMRSRPIFFCSVEMHKEKQS